jgi:hypothetical protein
MIPVSEEEKRAIEAAIEESKVTLYEEQMAIEASSNMEAYGLNKCDGLVIVEEALGNCLFRALSRALYNNPEFYNNVRQTICDYLEETHFCELVINNLFFVLNELNEPLFIIG